MSDCISRSEKSSGPTLVSLGFKTVRRPRAKDCEKWTLSEEEQPKRRKCVHECSYPMDNARSKKVQQAKDLCEQSVERYSFGLVGLEEAPETPKSPYRTPEKQIVSSRPEVVPPTPKKQFNSEIPDWLKDWPGSCFVLFLVEDFSKRV